MCATEAVLGAVSVEREGAVEIRRAAVLALVRQEQLQERLSRLRREARFVEEQAARAFERGEDVRGRQILAGGLCTLEARDALEREIEAARRDVHSLVETMLHPHPHPHRRGAGSRPSRPNAR